VSSYLPVAEHGLIGDLHSVALVGTDGTIDWYCGPRFDSPGVFASILDARRGAVIARLLSMEAGRRFLQSSERVLREHSLTPEGYDLLLAIKGAPDGSERVTVGEPSGVLGIARAEGRHVAPSARLLTVANYGLAGHARGRLA
jgi:Trehalase-like, N-terminal